MLGEQLCCAQAVAGFNRKLAPRSQMADWELKSPNVLENTGIILFWQKLFFLCVRLYAEAEDFGFLWLALQMMH